MNYYIYTFGCQMNVHDSEKIAGILKKLNYNECSDVKDADIVVFNTCCIRDTAEKRALGNIGALKPLKRAKPDMIIAVLGCMPQQSGMAEIISGKFPFVDIILGTANLHTLGARIEEILTARLNRKKRKISDTYMESGAAVCESEEFYRTSFPNAWVNIMYGCDNFCTYCIVPYVRGREKSRKFEKIIDETNNLLLDGFKEITLLGQNVNSYGIKGGDGRGFAELLKEIAELDYKFRLRFMTSHPKDLSDEIIAVMASHKNIAKSLHLPVQAGSNAVLKAMNRRYTREDYIELTKKIRSHMPSIGLTTDIMVGFPGETEQDFLETLDLVEKVRFSNAFTFIYSPRKGTPASSMEQIPYPVKKERIAALIELQNKISAELSAGYIGKTYEVLAEDAPKPGYLCGRTDSGRLVTFKGESSLIGNFLNVAVTSARASALKGEIINEH